MYSHRQHQCATAEAISSISILSVRPGYGCGRGSAAGDGVRGAVTELIGDIEIKSFSLVPSSNTEEIPVHVRHQRLVISIRHRVLVENVAAADVPAIVKISRHTQLIHPACLPVQVHWFILNNRAAGRR